MDILPIKGKIRQHLWEKGDGRSIRMGIGCAYMGKGEGDNFTEAEDDLRLLMRTYEEGFRYYDTSSAYEGGRSESMLGEFIKRIPRESIFLATKSRYEWRKGADPFALFAANFFRSFEKMQTDYIDSFQIHDTEHFACCEAEVIPFLLEQQEKGLIGYVGTGMRSLNAHELAVRSGHVQSVLSYQNYSLLTRAAAPLIRLCKERDCAFINASVLHFGMIKSEDPLNFGRDGAGKSIFESHMNRLRMETAKLQSLCREKEISILAPALQYSLLNPNIDMTLNGVKSMSNIESTIGAIEAIVHPEIWAAIEELQSLNPYADVQDDLAY